ncbi:site-specific integrase [Tardiphaga sp. vice304]|uniref:site-specific integrase n=1 Tax=Tardiphaga sp. vice304 TaxID=2592817 RepID=UPI001161F493|nr:site-specific integrase [Tardiphaga sp. vice304]QDM27555.1 site-specific integrase [Tardiphaga sp. vice304]
MSLGSNIARRSGSARYYARLGVPPDLQSVVMKKEYWKSLGTSDPKLAREKVLPVLIRWRAEFAELRRRREPTAADLQLAAWNLYEADLTYDSKERAGIATGQMVEDAKVALQTQITAGAVAWSDDPLVQLDATLELQVMSTEAQTATDSRAIRIKVLRNHLASGETALTEWAADDVIARDRLLIGKGTLAYRDLCQRLQRAELEYLLRAAERDSGNWGGTPSDPLVSPPDATIGKRFAAPGETILELHDRFAAEKRGSVTTDTWEQNRKILLLFVDFVGATSHVSAINKKAVRNWKHKLALWPVKALSIKAFDGLSFVKIIEANAIHKRPTISQNTINKYLSAIAGFAEWLLNHEYIEQDAMRGMFLSVDDERKGSSFSDSQLKTIFHSPLFKTCAGDGSEHLHGEIAVRDWRYWIPYICLYTGARLGEIAQLLTADVRLLHGVWIFHITREGSISKSTKTAGSQRVVPIHRELIRLGLIDYHSAMVALGHARLFPELQPDIRGFYSATPSRFLNRYFRKIGAKVDSSVNVHSLRHGMADAFRRCGYLDEQFGGPILGHAKETMTGRYGNLPEGILSERVKMIEAVSFPSLEN